MLSVSVEFCCANCVSDNSNAPPVSRLMEDCASVVVAAAVAVGVAILFVVVVVDVKESLDFIRMMTLGL